MEIRSRLRQNLGLLLMLISPVCVVGGLWREWWEVESRTQRENGPGGMVYLYMPSFTTLPRWPLWVAGLGLLLGLCGLVLLAVRSRSREG